MADVVVFGLQDFSELAHYYLTHDSPHNVIGFTVHEKYREVVRYKGLPVVPFEEVEKEFPVSECNMFAPLSPVKMNTLRQNVFNEAKDKGFSFISYVSSKATYYQTSIGENCFIFENNVIQPFTQIGNNTILWSGNHIGHHSQIGDHCFLSSHVVVSGHVTIENNCFLGVNSTLLDGVRLAKFSYIGAGALIASNTDEFGVYPGVKSEISKVPSNRLIGK